MDGDTPAIRPSPGARCACSCGCARPINAGNVMQQVVAEPERDWNGDALTNRVSLLICLNCYTGGHSLSETFNA